MYLYSLTVDFHAEIMEATEIETNFIAFHLCEDVKSALCIFSGFTLLRLKNVNSTGESK
jgi:hypothetical protein